MSVRLSETDRQMLDGERGEAARMAMSIVARLADAVGADELMDVTQAHIDGCGLLSDAGLEFAETLAARGGRVSIPTTLNMGPLDLQDWRSFSIDASFAAKALRQADAYTRMGCVPTWTCAPYQGYLVPRFGQQIAWGESNAIAYANSVLGARTERYGDYIDICAAITARVPKWGLHLAGNRRGQVLLRLIGFDDATLEREEFYPVLGHLVGWLAEDKVPVIDGLPPTASDDDLKAFCAAAASSGSVALFHAVGVTPEAPTLNAAFGGGEAARAVEIHPADWQRALDDLSTADEGAELDLVLLGCPHFSFAEFRRLVKLVRRLAAGDAGAEGDSPAEGAAPGGRAARRAKADVLVFTSRASYALVAPTGWLDELAAFGVRVTRDTCMFHTPVVAPGVRTIMTNSGKCAYYAPGELGVRVAFGSLADCVRSAAAGRVHRTASKRPAARAKTTSSRSDAGTAAEPTRGRERGVRAPWRGGRESAQARTLRGRAIVAGEARGRALVSDEPISFWGGLDPRSGEIIDRRHDGSGRNVAGKVFVFPRGKGSSTGSAILLESVRAGTAPKAIVNAAPDAIVALGAIVADALYGRSVPVVVLDEDAFCSIRDGDDVTIEADGTVRLAAGR